MSIRSLGYIGLTVTDAAAFTDFATNVLGLMSVTTADGVQRLRMDEFDWRFQVEKGDKNEAAFLGFEVANAEELEAVSSRLRSGGIEVQAGDAALKAQRGVIDLITCKDPEGLTVEIYYGQLFRLDAPFVSPAGVTGFLTGSQGLGHVAMATNNIDEARKFYQTLLGFRLTDYIDLALGPNFVLRLEFFHCNPRHHTLALAPFPAPTRLQHVMVQATSIDDVGLAYDRAIAAKAPIAQSLGRHTNDRMLSFYVVSPAGFQFEFGYGAVEVDDATWTVTSHDKGSVWGHKQAIPEFPENA